MSAALQTVKINAHDIGVKEYQGKRVVTFREIDECHERPEGTARKRFNDSKRHFIEGEDYFVRKTDEAAKEYGIIAPNGLVLITETGYLMLVKSFTDDLAWGIQRQLVSNYFQSVSKMDDLLRAKMEIAMLNARARLLEAENQSHILASGEVSRTPMAKIEKIENVLGIDPLVVSKPLDDWRKFVRMKLSHNASTGKRPCTITELAKMAKVNRSSLTRALSAMGTRRGYRVVGRINSILGV